MSKAKIDSIARRVDNGGVLVMIEIKGRIFAKWFEANPSDVFIECDYQYYGARMKRKYKGEYRPYDQSSGRFLD